MVEITLFDELMWCQGGQLPGCSRGVFLHRSRVSSPTQISPDFLPSSDLWASLEDHLERRLPPVGGPHSNQAGLEDSARPRVTPVPHSLEGSVLVASRNLVEVLPIPCCSVTDSLPTSRGLA